MAVNQTNYKVTKEQKENSRVSVTAMTKQQKEAMRRQETTQQTTKQVILAIRLTMVTTARLSPDKLQSDERTKKRTHEYPSL
jgi:hypothetical protein